MKTYIINGSEVSGLSVAIHRKIFAEFILQPFRPANRNLFLHVLLAKTRWPYFATFDGVCELACDVTLFIPTSVMRLVAGL